MLQAEELRMSEESEADEKLAALLRDARTIAVVGFKNGQTEDAYRVPLYMQQHGYHVLPVNPKLARAGASALGERVGGALPQIDDAVRVDIVNLFRAPENIAAHAEEVLAMSPLPRAVWMQLGIVHNDSAAKLRAAGIEVVQNRCIMVEHRRLLAG
jgi:predicted CoA-binding protein